MFLWFCAVSFALVMIVFDSPALDYRLVMLGSVLPWLDYLWGPPWVMHSVFFPVAAMSAVMMFGWGRRLVQRRWLGLAIGLFMHLVLAGTWTSADLFWWPAFGWSVDGVRPQVPPFALALILELLGAGVAVWLWRRLGLSMMHRRSELVRSGRVDRSIMRD